MTQTQIIEKVKKMNRRELVNFINFCKGTCGGDYTRVRKNDLVKCAITQGISKLRSEKLNDLI